MTQIRSCNLCREAIASGGELTDGIVALPSVGALTEGHTLVCPVSHARSVASLPQSSADALLSAADGFGLALSALTGMPTHWFEHGNASHGTRIACSVEHAHLHLVPADVDLSVALDEIGSWRQVEWGAAALSSATAEREYLLYRAPSGDARLLTTEGRAIPSQLMRRLISEALGRPGEWNWREHGAPERMAASRDVLRQLVAA